MLAIHGDAEAGDWQQLQSGHPSTQRSDNGLITVNQRPSYSDSDEKVGGGEVRQGEVTAVSLISLPLPRMEPGEYYRGQRAVSSDILTI